VHCGDLLSNVFICFQNLVFWFRFQELDLSKNVYIFSESAREEEWLHRVEDALHVKTPYKKVSWVKGYPLFRQITVGVDASNHFRSCLLLKDDATIPENKP